MEDKTKLDMGDVSDGYHTFNELYEYRLLYNAAKLSYVVSSLHNFAKA